MVNIQIQKSLKQCMRLNRSEGIRKIHKKYSHIRTSRVQVTGNHVNRCQDCIFNPTPRPICKLLWPGPSDRQQLLSAGYTCLSKHLATTEVRATGRKSFTALAPVFFGIGIMVEVFHLQHADSSAWESWANIGPSRLAQFQHLPPPPPPPPLPASSPGILCGWTWRKHFVVSGSLITAGEGTRPSHT